MRCKLAPQLARPMQPEHEISGREQRRSSHDVPKSHRQNCGRYDNDKQIRKRKPLTKRKSKTMDVQRARRCDSSMQGRFEDTDARYAQDVWYKCTNAMNLDMIITPTLNDTQSGGSTRKQISLGLQHRNNQIVCVMLCFRPRACMRVLLYCAFFDLIEFWAKCSAALISLSIAVS